MTTFGLVHGAWHGAWCWALLAEELRGRGHTVIAPELPCDDPTAGADQYAHTTIAALDQQFGGVGAGTVGEDIVLVGHSLGGLTVPVVAQHLAARGRAVARMVLLAPLLPLPGRSFHDLRTAEPDRFMPGYGAGQIRNDDGSSTWLPQAAIATMYPDAPPQVAEWAAAQLRPQHWSMLHEVTPLTAWPPAKVTVIACAADAVVNPDWVRRTAGVRFGVEARVLAGDHSPFLSRPRELADLLVSG